MADRYERLKLERQLCFPLYAASKEVVRHYKPFLDELDMTYTQYIAMMVLWEHKELTVKDLGKYLYLDSGTLTPLLKTMEKKGWIIRCRSSVDERVLIVTLTENGELLRDKALLVQKKMSGCVNLEKEDAEQLYKILYKILENL